METPRVTEDLGAVQQTVSRAIDELPESVKLSQQGQVNTDEKREQGREFDRVSEDTQQAIAEDLGVSEYLVSKSKTELENSVKQFDPKSLNTDEKRDRVREFVEDNPTTPGPADSFTACSRW